MTREAQLLGRVPRDGLRDDSEFKRSLYIWILEMLRRRTRDAVEHMPVSACRSCDSGHTGDERRGRWGSEFSKTNNVLASGFDLGSRRYFHVLSPRRLSAFLPGVGEEVVTGLDYSTSKRGVECTGAISGDRGLGISAGWTAKQKEEKEMFMHVHVTIRTGHGPGTRRIQDEDKHQGHDIRWVMPISRTGISAGGDAGVWGSSRIGISDRNDAGRYWDGGRCWLHERK